MGFVENVNTVATSLTSEFIDSVNNAASISQMTVSVHDLPEGSSATATWDNSTSVMDLGIPAGATGATGLTGDTGTGIQSIVKTSTVGDVDTYTITFTDLSTTTFDVTNGKDGVDGVIGVDGLSAYQIALSNGFVGTEAQWLESLNGDNGKSITSVTTSKTGKDTTVTIDGTFDNSPSVFHILDGVDGTGDMLKSTYDTNNNGKVDTAEVADSVAWTGVTGKPSTYPPSMHSHVVSDITDFPTLSAVATSGSYNDLSDKLTVGDGGLTEKNFTSTLKTKLETDVAQDIINESTAVKLYSGTRRSGWTKGLSGFTGAICIELVNLFGYSMDGLMSIRIKETNSKAIRLSISGRWNASTSWGEYYALADSVISVRFARDASKVYLIIGDVSTVWGNTRLEIDDVLTNYNVGQSLSFSITTLSSLTGYTVDATLSTTRLLSSDIGVTVQGYDADLNAIASLSETSGLLKKTATNTWSLDTNTYLTGNQSITVSGDAAGSGTTSIALTLADSGVTSGTYKSVTVDAKGRVTNGTNPTTISGYGITDSYTKTEVDTSLSGKQATLVSGTNIKTINGSSVLGSGDLTISGGTGGATGGGTDAIFWENGQTITTDYAITAGKNAGTFGAVVIADGVVVTIPDNSTWTVV